MQIRRIPRTRTMAIPSKEYWARRSAERMIDYTAEAEKTANKIGKAYYNAGKYLSDEAGKVAKSFGKAFDLSEAEALRLMKNPPGKTMIQQLKAAVSGISDPDKRKELEAVISSPAYAYRIGRLEQVEKNIRDSCAKLYNTELKADESFFRSLPITAYERTIFDVQKAIGISSSFAQFPESRVNRILSTKWSGEHFSGRVWTNTNTLANGLQHDMLVGIMAGKSEVHMADDIMARMGGGAYAARRVVRTETNYIANQAELDGYKECGLENYEFSAHLDNRTSEICADMDGKVFDLKDAQAGTNLPPMHPFCRSSTVPVLPSEEELDRIIQQDGDAIGADVDFEEWKSHLVENEDGKLVYRVDNSAESGIIEAGQFKTFSSGEDVNDFFYYDGEERGIKARRNSIHGKWLNSLSLDEKETISWYTADGYGDINDYWRKREGWKYIPAEMVQDASKNIDAAISRFELKENIMVQRGVEDFYGESLIENKDWNDIHDIVGMTYRDLGYSSTTALTGNGVATAKPYLFEIEIPAGKGRGAYVNRLAGLNKDVEYEFLVARDSKFKITGVKINDEPIPPQTIIKMRMIVDD